MIVFRRRLIYWILKEYIKKWGKTIIFFFFIGLALFFFLKVAYGTIIPKLPTKEKITIGMVGSYRLEALPPLILTDIASGLTTLAPDGTVKPGIAKSWKIEKDGKKYTFLLQNNLRFTDGTKVTAKTISYNFLDTKKTAPNDNTIVFEIKETYAPFLVRVSEPMLQKNLYGVGTFKIKNIRLNGDFIEYITLTSAENKNITRTYQFYASEEALKTAYVLGEISQAVGLANIDYSKSNFTTFPNTHIEKKANTIRLVTIFYNTQDSILSSREIRSALTYALPNEFENGQRNYAPYAPTLWAFASQYTYSQDLETAKILLENSGVATKSARLAFTIKTLPQYKKTAEVIKEAWKPLDIEAKIETVDKIPHDFQIFLGDFMIPKDPDQYSLWHSNQPNNITRYDNQRIDKILEDGRQMENPSIAERKKIYADFQKYLLADAPAAFLYFPYEYTLMRK